MRVPHQCPFCGDQLNTAEELQDHLKGSHIGVLTEDDRNFLRANKIKPWEGAIEMPPLWPQ